jgi:fumarate reductase flavoprotein subunit
VKRYSAWPHFVSTAPEIAYAYVADYLRLRRDVAVRAGSLGAIARSRTLPQEALESTVAQFNRYVAGEAEDPWGRTLDRHPLEGRNWVLLGPAKAYFTTTEGSAAINQSFQVLDRDGEPIPGLYAVGQIGLGGQILWGHGLHIAWALTSGRLAGRVVARSQPCSSTEREETL